MKWRSVISIAALGMWTFSSSGAAQVSPTPLATAPASSEPPTVWDLEWQDSHCTISTGDTKSIGLSLWVTPGDPDPQLYVFGSSKILPRELAGPPQMPLRKPRTVTVALAPTGESFQAEVDAVSESSRQRVVKLRKLRHKFPPAFAKASEIRLVTAQGPIPIPIHGAAKAMDALQGCIDQKLTDWGLDAKAFAGLRKPPTDIEGYQWVTYQDYPSSALDQNAMGAVIARLNVDATGKVSDCAVVVKSGSAALDKVTCDRALMKGRFDPAIGPDGQPTAASRVVRVEFKIWQ